MWLCELAIISQYFECELLCHFRFAVMTVTNGTTQYVWASITLRTWRTKITTVAVCDCTVCVDICNLEDLKDEDYHCGCVWLQFVWTSVTLRTWRMKITTVAVCDCTVCVDISNLEDLKDKDYHCGCVWLQFVWTSVTLRTWRTKITTVAVLCSHFSCLHCQTSFAAVCHCSAMVWTDSNFVGCVVPLSLSSLASWCDMQMSCGSRHQARCHHFQLSVLQISACWPCSPDENKHVMSLRTTDCRRRRHLFESVPWCFVAWKDGDCVCTLLC